MRYTPKQIEKYNRQKYISYIEKIKKNLFTSFRNREVNASTLKRKMADLMEGFEKLEKIRLDSEYMRESQKYIDDIYRKIMSKEFDNSEMDSIRDEQLNRLNRLQKMKNQSRYKKDKYLHRNRRDGWE